MSITLTGNPANVTTPLVATITALSSDGGLVKVATAAPHLFGTYDLVSIAGTGVADGQWPITVIDSTHFDLVGSTYSSTATGTATNLSLTPQISVPTDGDTFSCQISGLLSSQQATLDRTQYLQRQALASQNQTLTLPALNWSMRMLCPSADGQNSATWDPVGNVWMVGANSSSTFVRLETTAGFDNAVGAVGTPAVKIIGTPDISPSGTAIADSVARDQLISGTASGSYYISFLDQTAHTAQVFACNPSGANSWVSTRTISSVVTHLYLVTLPSGTLVYYQVGTTLAATGVSYSTDQGTTWHDSVYDSPTLPLATNGILKSNGSIVIAMPRLNGSASLNYLTSTDGHSWTSQNLPASVITTILDYPSGLDWDATNSLWILAITRNVTKTAIYSSPDGSTWTFVSEFTIPSHVLSDLACVGQTYVAVTTDESSGGPCRVVYSIDKGLSWRYAPAWLAANWASADAHWTPPRLASGPNGFALLNALEFRFSMFAGAPAGKAFAP